MGVYRWATGRKLRWPLVSREAHADCQRSTAAKAVKVQLSGSLPSFSITRQHTQLDESSGRRCPVCDIVVRDPPNGPGPELRKLVPGLAQSSRSAIRCGFGKEP